MASVERIQRMTLALFAPGGLAKDQIATGAGIEKCSVGA
jgi:hypothetical protein